MGAGKYGHVYIVRYYFAKLRHKKTSSTFALKKVSKRDVDEAMMKQICHEIKIQFMIDHPNIVKLYAFFNDKDSVYLLL